MRTRTAAAAALALLLAAPASAAGAKGRAEDAVRESILLLASGDVGGARRQARAAVAADPASPAALQQLARADNAALDFAGAEEAAERALAVSGPSAALLCLRSEARAGEGDYGGALADANEAARLSPGSGAAILRRAIAKEGLGRPAEEALADYRRAAELDAALSPLRDEAVARLAAAAPAPRRRLGWLVGLLCASAVAGWAWGLRRGPEAAAGPAAPPAAAPSLPGSGRLSPREAARALAAAAAGAADVESARALAESLYERLTGRPPFPPEDELVARRLGRFAPPSSLAAGLPVGVDAFFARALDPDPARRFRSGAELAGAFRSLVDPAVE